MRKITKAVFPVAGLGSRFLPVTKASPKEMLPIVDKPLIQYAVEEAAAAGITDMVFITGRNKRAIEDHFDKAYELETELALRNKIELLEMVQSAAPPGVNCIYIRQTEALGLGHAVLCAAPVIGDEPFAVLLADDLIDGPGGVTLIDWQCPATGDATEDLATFLSPAMQWLYRGRVLSPPETEAFLAAYPDPTVTARDLRLQPLYRWRRAAHCLWKADRGAPDYRHALALELAP